MNHPTIRNLTGATAPESIDATRSALLLIDFQNEYFTGRMPLPEGEQALHNAQRLLAHADQSGIPVFHVQHVTPVGSPIFAEGSVSGDFHRDLQPATQHSVVRKTSVSVFPSTNLDQLLRDAGVDTLIIAGLMTHACVAGAARDAVPLGYSVLVVGDACATRDLDSSGGIHYGALHRAALASIDDTFGDILNTEEFLRLPLR